MAKFTGPTQGRLSPTEHPAVDSVTKRMTLALSLLAGFMGPLNATSPNVALPVIGAYFSIDALMMGWVAMAFPLSAAVFNVPFGRLADIYGRKRIFAAGMSVLTIASLICGLSRSDLMLIAGRVLQGIGIAMIFSTSTAMVTSTFGPGERGRALGLMAATTYIGLSVGPLFGGFLTQHLGWRSVFLVNVPLSVLAAVGIFWLKGEWAEARGEKFDYIGSLIYCLGLVAVMFGFSELPEVRGIVTFSAGVLVTVFFFWWETRTPSPVLHIDLFRHNLVFTMSNLAALISYAATYAVTFLLSLYLQYTKGFTPEHAGLILVVMPAMQAIFSPAAGRFSDRIEARILVSAGMVLTTIGLALLTVVNADTGIPYLVMSLAILGTGFGIFSSPNTNAVMSSVNSRRYGVASATLSTARQVGMTFSMGIVMLVFALYLGKVEITPEYYPLFLKSMRVAFLIFAALCFGGIFASAARGKVR